MSPQSRRGPWTVLALALLLAPGLAQAQIAPQEPTLPGGDPIPDPDFVPGGSTVEATHELEPARVCVNVYNVEGDERTLHRPFDVVLHVDGMEAATARVQETLYKGQGAKRCWNLTMAPGVHAYSFVVDALDEVREQREDNNAASERYFFVDERPKPDLRVDLLDVAPRQSREGRPQVMVAYVRNVGNLASPDTSIDFTDATGLLGRLPVRALEPGQTQDVVLMTQSDLRAPGEYVLDAMVDPDNLVVEWNESNNARILPYVVSEHPLPDLALRNLTLEGERVAGAALHLNATIVNAGTRAMASSQRLLVRVLDGEEPIHNESRAPLGVGQAAPLRLLLRMPEGEHDLRVVLDPEGAVAELDEANNEEGTTLVLAPPRLDPRIPNLLVERLDAMPNDPRPGETVTLVALVRNGAEVRAPESHVEFSVNGRRVGASPAPALEPGHYASVAFSWPAHSEGSYTLRALADAAGVVAESDEEDNVLARTFVVVAPPPPTPPAQGGGADDGAGNGTGNGTAPPPPANGTAPPGGDGTGAPPPASGNASGDAQVVLGDVTVHARAVPGGAKGTAVASLRNARLEPLGRLSVAFKVDGRTLKEVLVEGVAGAATVPVTSGEMQLPPGDHALTVEVRLLSAGAAGTPLASATTAYDQPPGEAESPAPGTVLVLAAVGALAALWRRRLRPRVR